MKTDLQNILESLQSGRIGVEEAMLAIKKAPFVELGYAKVDLHRAVRQGAPEVIYGAGKTAEQIIGIVEQLRANGQTRLLITRLDADKADAVGRACELEYHREANLALLGGKAEPDGLGTVVVVSGGTSDMPVAEEAALTAEAYGNAVVRVYDVGVAGLHRVLSQLDTLMRASVVIAVAGMEGALASVVGGLVDCPVIAVPTSVGYGASFQGVSALLSMLNSCASGVSVVNIDNGFGAGFLASRINHMEAKK